MALQYAVNDVMNKNIIQLIKIGNNHQLKIKMILNVYDLVHISYQYVFCSDTVTG